MTGSEKAKAAVLEHQRLSDVITASNHEVSMPGQTENINEVRYG